MALMAVPWAFAHTSTNLTGTPSATRAGTGYTPGASNAEGTAVSVLSALTHDVHYLIVGGDGGSSGSAHPYTLADVLLDPAGGTSWSDFIQDLIIGGHTSATAQGNYNWWYHFPIFIKSGTSVGFRARGANATGRFGTVVMFAHGTPSNPEMWWCGSGVEGLGLTPGSSSGTDITPGNSGTWGSWTTIGTSTHPYGFVQFGHNTTDSSTVGGIGYHLQLGYGSQKLPGSMTQALQMSGNEYGGRAGHQIPIWCDVASGTTWQMRATSSSATPETLNVALYGVY